MEDKNIYNNHNSEDFDRDNEKLPEEEVKSYVEDNKDLQAGEKALQEELPTQKTSDESEEQGAKREAEDSSAKEENPCRSTCSDEIKDESAEYVWNANPECSWSNTSDSTYHMKPDNMKEYVGRRSGTYSSPYGYSQAAYSFEPEDDKKKKKSKKGILIALVAVLVALAIVASGAAGYYLRGNDTTPPVVDIPDDNSNETVSMVKNDEPVKVDIEHGSTGYSNLSRADVVELVADAVVEITTSIVQTNSFFGGNYVTSGAGSGVVIAQSDEYAYIVTNYHVISGASSVSVTLTDRTVVEAEYLDGDVSHDIAMIRIKTDKKFPKIVCGSSDSIRVGEDVVAIGNPLGQLGGTVTEGIISALDRTITIDGMTMTLIQTSAAVNPGNSGGGLFNMSGELIGIVNAKQSAEGIEGLGFAIPIDSVYDMLVEIIETKYIHGRPTLGIEVKYVTDSWTARIEYGVGATGVFVTSSNNDKLVAKDLLRSIDGQLITDNSSYAAVISSLTVGETVTVELYRKGKLTTVDVEVVEYVPSGIFG